MVAVKSIPSYPNSTVSMLEMVAKYSSAFPHHSGNALPPAKEVVLLTGTTGGFGCYLLSHLLSQAAVSRVYALNRGPYATMRARQEAGFTAKQLDPRVLESPKLVMLEANLPNEKLGVNVTAYEEMKSTITCIIHNAWDVNFEASLLSQEPLLLGTRNLVDLALSSALSTLPRFLFTSSVVLFQNWNAKQYAPETSITASVACHNGYTESKWVAEQILHHAGESTALQPVIVRLGQLVGDTTSGAWITSDWIPRTICSSQSLGCAPLIPGDVSWVPFDIAASALFELRTSPERYVHLVHPTASRCQDIFTIAARALDVPVVSFNEWVKRLEASGRNDVVAPAKNPALSSLGFFRELAHGSGIQIVEKVNTDVARKNSPSLERLRGHPIGTEEISKWISYWRSVHFLS